MVRRLVVVDGVAKDDGRVLKQPVETVPESLLFSVGLRWRLGGGDRRGEGPLAGLGLPYNPAWY